MGKMNRQSRIAEYVMQIELEDEITIKQIACLLLTRLMNPMTAEETAGMILGLAEAERKLKKAKEIMH
jgi:hypothetical protein